MMSNETKNISVKTKIDRSNCPMRHENGNCLSAGGFCMAVNDEICAALHNAYESGRRYGALQAENDKENDKWISIYARKPSEEDLQQSPYHMFLVCSCGEVREAMYDPMSGQFRKHGPLTGVSHWQPLPQPFKEDELLTDIVKWE